MKHHLLSMLLSFSPFAKKQSVFVKQERAKDKRIEPADTSQFPGWAWQMHRQGSATPMPLFSTAASSGFSFSATPPLAAPVTLHATTNPQSAHNLCFASPATTSANTFHYYYHMKPPQPEGPQ